MRDCPRCHKFVGLLDWVTCASCLARHHAECWRGMCDACGERLSSQAVEQLVVSRVSARAVIVWGMIVGAALAFAAIAFLTH